MATENKGLRIPGKPLTKEEENEIRGIWRQFGLPPDNSVLKNPKAARALLENQKNQGTVKYTGNTGKRNSTVTTYTNKTAGTEVQVKDTPNARRGRSRDVGFRDTGAEGYNQRANRGTVADRQLRSAVVQDQISRAVPPQQSGDRLTANPTSAGRARLYESAGGTPLASGTDRNGGKVIDTKTLRSGNTINAQGQKGGPIDLSRLRIPLQRQAITRVIGQLGPYGRAMATVMSADDLLKGLTGKSGMELWQELIKKSEGVRPVKPTSGLMKF